MESTNETPCDLWETHKTPKMPVTTRARTSRTRSGGTRTLSALPDRSKRQSQRRTSIGDQLERILDDLTVDPLQPHVRLYQAAKKLEAAAQKCVAYRRETERQIEIFWDCVPIRCLELLCLFILAYWARLLGTRWETTYATLIAIGAGSYLSAVCCEGPFSRPPDRIRALVLAGIVSALNYGPFSGTLI